MRRPAAWLLGAIVLALLLADFLAPHSYSTQFRASPDAPASLQFPLGTDSLGRDRLSRLLFGGRLSILCAPAAALVSVLLALGAGLTAGALGKRSERITGAVADLFLSLPWLFALLAVRALLPLNAAPWKIAVVTFALLGLLGWAGPCRMIMAATRRHLDSDFALFALAGGSPRWRIALVHVVPNLLPVACAQFLVTVPAFLLAEANLGLLGLGVPEPLPSWGGLLRDLESFPAIAARPSMLAPAVLLFAVVGLFHLAVRTDENHV